MRSPSQKVEGDGGRPGERDDETELDDTTSARMHWLSGPFPPGMPSSEKAWRDGKIRDHRVLHLQALGERGNSSWSLDDGPLASSRSPTLSSSVIPQELRHRSRPSPPLPQAWKLPVGPDRPAACCTPAQTAATARPPVGGAWQKG